jgi:ketosteroid isomerase-like protein
VIPEDPIQVNSDANASDSRGEESDPAPTVIRRLLELVGSFRLDEAFTLVTDDLVLKLPFRGDGGPRRMDGEEAKSFIRSLPKLFATLPFRDVAIHGRLPSGLVVAEYRSDGSTHSGRPYRNTYLALFGMRDDRVATWCEYFDPSVVAEAFPST